MSRSGFRKSSAGLTIVPPSQDALNPTASGRAHHDGDHSPRRAPLPPSPTHSTYSGVSGVSGVSGSGASSAGVRGRRRSFDVPWANLNNNDRPPPPLPTKSTGEKRLPLPPGMSGVVVPPSPQRKAGPGLYDNKLMSSTLSQLPPIPPLSPNPTGTSALSNTSHHILTSSHVITPKPSFATMTSLASSFATPRPSIASSSSATGAAAAHHSGTSMILLPDGTALPVGPDGRDNRAADAGLGRSVSETVAHSSPSSPWSLLTIHVLPLFAGSPLKTAIEDINQLCLAHIMATSQRTSASRLIAVLGSDLRDFIASGMLTLKARIESAEDGKLVARTAEIWSFFWTQVVPYIEGVFLPISQLRDVPSASSGAASHQAISVRPLVLSGFLLHILLPLLPRLVTALRAPLPPSITTGTEASRAAALKALVADLKRILQMSLVLSTQATYSSFFPTDAPDERDRKNAEVRDSVEGLSRLVKWKIDLSEEAHAAATTAQSINPSSSTDSTQASGPGAAEPVAAWPSRTPMRRHPSMLQRGPSMSQGAKHRRKGWRTSTSSMQQAMAVPESYHPHIGRRNSDFLQQQQQPEARWGRVRIADDDDEDDAAASAMQGYSVPSSRQDSSHHTLSSTSGLTSTTTLSTLTAGTARDGQSLLLGDDQRTPQADFGRRTVRANSFGQQQQQQQQQQPQYLDGIPLDPRRINRIAA